MMNKLFHNLICGLRYKETLHYDLFNQNIFIDWQNPVYNLLVNYDKSNTFPFNSVSYIQKLGVIMPMLGSRCSIFLRGKSTFYRKVVVPSSNIYFRPQNVALPENSQKMHVGVVQLALRLKMSCVEVHGTLQDDVQRI